MSRVLFDISAHGLGHLAQTAPVIAALRARRDVTVLLRSGLPEAVLEQRIARPFELLAAETDFGLTMTTSYVVDRASTAARYRDLHADYAAHVARLGSDLQAAAVDLVVSNIGYLVLAAAQHAGIANMAFSSINWHDVVAHYTGSDCAGALADMAMAYRQTGVLLRLEPGTAMERFATVGVPAVIAARGHNRRRDLDDRVGQGRATVVFSFTDSETQAPPHLADAAMVAIGPAHWAARGRPWVSFAETGLSFLDLVASVDLIVAKPGYGIVTEAARVATPTLLTPRDDWPETGASSIWYRHHGRFETTHLPLDQLTSRHLFEAHDRLAGKDPGPPVAFDGDVRIAMDIVARLPR